MSRMNFTAHVMNVFKEMETSYDEIKNLMFDLYKGELDEIGRASCRARV